MVYDSSSSGYLPLVWMLTVLSQWGSILVSFEACCQWALLCVHISPSKWKKIVPMFNILTIILIALEIFRGNHHRRPLLDKPYWDRGGQRKQDCGFLRGNFKDYTTKVKSATYTTVVRPTLEYATTAWDPHKQKDAQLLEKAQRWAARYACNNFRDKTPGTIKLLLNTDSLEWHSLEQHSLHNRLQMLYRINNGLVDIDLSSFCHTQIPGQVEPSDYIRSTPLPAILSFGDIWGH